MKKALLLCLLPFLGYATQLKKGTNATVFIDGISYNRGTLTPVFTFSTDTFLQIQQNGTAIVIPIRKYSFYTDGDHSNVAFSSGAKLMLWCDSFINTPTYAIQQYLLSVSTDTSVLLHKADSNHYITPYYFNSNIPVLTGYVPYTGAAHDLQLGNHVLTANDGSFNTEVGTNLFGVENSAVTKYSVLTVNGLTVNSTIPATTMSITDSGLIFPDGGVQVHKGYSFTDTGNGKTLCTNANAEKKIDSLNPIIAGKQPQLSGTGFVKASGTSISYDNSTYLTAAVTSLTVDPTLTTTAATGAITVGLNVAHANIWTGIQTVQGTSLGNGLNAGGLILSTATAATAGNAQAPYGIELDGFNWNTAAGGSSEVSNWLLAPQMSSGGSPTSTLYLQIKTGAGAYATVAQFARSSMTFAQPVTCSNTLSTSTISIANGKKLLIGTAANGIYFSGTLSSGTITINNTSVTANSVFTINYTAGTTPTAGIRSTFRVSTITAGVSFVIVAENAAGTTNTTDNSAISGWFVN